MNGSITFRNMTLSDIDDVLKVEKESFCDTLEQGCLYYRGFE